VVEDLVLVGVAEGWRDLVAVVAGDAGLVVDLVLRADGGFGRREIEPMDVGDAKFFEQGLEALAVGEGVLVAAHATSSASVDEDSGFRLFQSGTERGVGISVNA
jgi:hypothetical protein